MRSSRCYSGTATRRGDAAVTAHKLDGHATIVQRSRNRTTEALAAACRRDKRWDGDNALAQVEDLCRGTFREALQPQVAGHPDALLRRDSRATVPANSGVTAAGCLIIKVQSHADLSFPKLAISAAHQSPSRGGRG